jgi:predicted small secreted protein
MTKRNIIIVAVVLFVLFALLIMGCGTGHGS